MSDLLKSEIRIGCIQLGSPKNQCAVCHWIEKAKRARIVPLGTLFEGTRTLESSMVTIDKSIDTWDSHVQKYQTYAQCMCMTQIVLWYTWDSQNRALSHMGLTQDSYGTQTGLRFESWQDSTNDKTQSILKTYISIYVCLLYTSPSPRD